MATASAAADWQPCRPSSGAQLCSGSKNRGSKPPVVIAHECPSVMRAHVLEELDGRDVLLCVSAFTRRGRTAS
jgi:hypothetical protein